MKTKKAYQIVSGVMSFMMAGGLLVGCGNNEAPKEEKLDIPKTEEVQKEKEEAKTGLQLFEDIMNKEGFEETNYFVQYGDNGESYKSFIKNEEELFYIEFNEETGEVVLLGYDSLLNDETTYMVCEIAEQIGLAEHLIDDIDKLGTSSELMLDVYFYDGIPEGEEGYGYMELVKKPNILVYEFETPAEAMEAMKKDIEAKGIVLKDEVIEEDEYLITYTYNVQWNLPDDWAEASDYYVTLTFGKNGEGILSAGAYNDYTSNEEIVKSLKAIGEVFVKYLGDETAIKEYQREFTATSSFGVELEAGYSLSTNVYDGGTMCLVEVDNW